MSEISDLQERIDALERAIAFLREDEKRSIIDTVDRINEINARFSRHLSAIVLMVNLLLALLVWYIITH